MTGPIHELLADARDALVGIGAGNPRFEAELLLAAALARPRLFFFTDPAYAPTEAEQARFAELLGRRLSGEPLQYVLGTAVFRSLTLRVGPGVLIPRSETEILVEILDQALRRRRVAWSAGDDRRAPGRLAADGSPGGRPWVIEVGVGSGAILLSLIAEALGRRLEDPNELATGTEPPPAGAVAEPGAGRGGMSRAAPGGLDRLWFRPIGLDVSPVALSVTAENAARNGLPCPWLFRGDLLSAIDAEGPVAAIVSNPPYIASAEMPALPAEIREHEPPVALHGGADGLDLIRALLDQAINFLAHGALLIFEIGATQDGAVRGELARRGLAECATIHPDLAGRPRVVLVDPGRAG